MAKQKKFVIIDTYSLLHRAWHAIPPLTTKKGLVVNAAYGFTSILLKLLKELKPDYIVAAFDLAAPTFRHEEFKEYKAQREKQPDELYQQVVWVENILDAFEIPRLSKVGYEADDIIGSVVRKLDQEHPELKKTIVTGDLDSLQLVNDQTDVYTLKRGLNDTITYDETAVKERYGLKPEQLIEMKAIMGDTSDNIPGVKGIGEKGAQDLIKEFKSLDGVYENLNSPKIKDRLRQLLTDQKKQAYQSKRLVTIVTDLKLPINLKQAQTHSFSKEKVYEIFKELEFNSLIDKIPEPSLPLGDTGEEKPLKTPAVHREGEHYELIRGLAGMKKLAGQLKKLEGFALDTETTGLDPLVHKILGASFSWQPHHGVYVSLRTDPDRENFKKIIGPILASSKIAKTGHNLKFDYEVLKQIGITVQGICFDSLVAAFLLKPDRGLKLEELAFNYYGIRMQKLSDIAEGKGDKLDVAGIPEDKLAWYAAEDADFAWRLYKSLKDELKEVQLTKLMDKIETPLISILAEMELAGISIDTDLLKKMEKKFDHHIENLSKKIYIKAGKKFNISSPLQLKEILFDTLNIASKGIKKTKTGLSTAASELDKMNDLHPIIPLISEYRELTKLQSTYITALPKLLGPDERIHTSFNQAVTATGRLSSSNPNLQNIPIRTELGREIRAAFIAKRGYQLLSADYSQIELRLVAHVSGDPIMIKSFRNGEDIHSATAAKINKIPIEKVSFDERRKAKEINFGVIYGLGSLGLAQRTGLTRDEAKAFIEKYFSLYKGVKKYINETKMEVRDQGYVETLFGRRRYLPEINSTMPQLVAQAERMAVNMPLQGSAADIMKLAMIQLASDLPDVSPDSKILLQVHDELVLEVPKDEVAKVAKIVKKIMQEVAALKVPLIVDVKAGKSWAGMERV